MSPPTTAADHAFVTLITSDSYLPGALAQAAALNDLHPTRRGGPFPTSIELEQETDPVPFTTVCLVTPETVAVESIKQLRRTFDLVIGVEVIEGDKDAEEIKLLGRPDLHQTFTKLHALRLAQFASIVFLDADVLPLRPMSHLLKMVSSWPDEYFHEGGDTTPTATAPGVGPSETILTLSDSSSVKRNAHRLHNSEYPCPLSAAPDSGWPDIFNSGVFALAPPGERGFKEAMGLRSWDGGDQGTLNEWIGRQGGLSTGQGSGGPGWNRLSFRYNVTPTAAYTYAPAYAKFGAAIHAVHFIGPSKPWASIPFRPAHVSSNGQPVDKYVIGAYGPQGAPTLLQDSAYSYYTLLDRWFAVYDAHFRIMEGDGTEPKSEFEVHKYESAWDGGKAATSPGEGTAPAPDQRNQYPHVVPPHTYHVAVYSDKNGLQPATSFTASLEELRRLALHGVGRADAPREGEGAYISMPLEGRISLMRPPRPEPKPVVEQEHHHHHHESHHHHEPQHHEHHHHESHRPASPPVVHWNPAFEPPPQHFNAAPQGLPDGAYYQNQWDMPQQNQNQFFNPPPQTHYIPKELTQDGQYSSMQANGFQPDASQVKSIFPWEERGRPAPERKFPDSAPPPPVQKVASPAERPASPPRELGVAYQNAWDDIPSIQRYASRLTGARLPPSGKDGEQAIVAAEPSVPQPQPEWSWERDRGQGEDASSREGDDEDDDSDIEETQTVATSITGGTGSSELNNTGNGGSRPKLGSRAGSRTASLSKGSISSPPKAAQSLRGNQGIPLPGNSANAPLKGFQSYLSEKRKAQGALEGPMDFRTRLATLGSGAPTFLYPSGIEPQLPGFVQTSMPGITVGARGDRVSTPSMAEPSFEFTRALPTSFTAVSSLSVAGTLGSALDVLSHTQTISSDSEMTDDSSPSSPTGSSSPNLEPSAPPPPLRTWDESRSVDAFKRDSQEILARFLKMGSWGGGSETPPDA